LSAIIGRQVSAIGSIIPANISEIANKAAEAAIRSGLLPSTNAVPQAAPSSAQNRQAMERGEKDHSCEPT
jgi:hypothetical protein